MVSSLQRQFIPFITSRNTGLRMKNIDIYWNALDSKIHYQSSMMVMSDWLEALEIVFHL